MFYFCPLDSVLRELPCLRISLEFFKKEHTRNAFLNNFASSFRAFVCKAASPVIAARELQSFRHLHRKLSSHNFYEKSQDLVIIRLAV